MFFHFEGFTRRYHHKASLACEGIHVARHQHLREIPKGEFLLCEPSSLMHIGWATLSLLFPSSCLHDTSTGWRTDIEDGPFGCTFGPSLMPRHRALVYQNSFGTLHQNLHIC